MPDLTLEQIEREPEKWEYRIRLLYRGRWRFFYTPQSLEDAHDFLWGTKDRALFARPAGTTQPFRKVRE